MTPWILLTNQPSTTFAWTVVHSSCLDLMEKMYCIINYISVAITYLHEYNNNLFTLFFISCDWSPWGGLKLFTYFPWNPAMINFLKIHAYEACDIKSTHIHTLISNPHTLNWIIRIRLISPWWTINPKNILPMEQNLQKHCRYNFLHLYQFAYSLQNH